MFKIGMLCKLKDIPGDYRARIIAIGDSGTSLYFKDHPVGMPYSAASYEPDLDDSQTNCLVNCYLEDDEVCGVHGNWN